MSSDLSVSLLGVRMAKPWMNASGVLADVFVQKEWSKYLGAVVTKSAGYRPRQGYETPNICAPSDDSLLNAMGLPNPGYAEICAELDEASIGVPVVGSFYGDTAEQA